MPFLIAFMVFGAATTTAWGIIHVRMGHRVATQMRLERVAGRLAQEWNVTSGMVLRSSRLSNIAWVEQLLQSFDVARRIDLLLIRSDWSLRVSEFLALLGITTGLGFVVGAVFLNSLLFAFPLALVGGYLPWFILKRAVGKRRKTLEKQLVEALALMSNSLKAGFGLMQALDQAARHLEDPIAKEIKQTIRDTQIGSSVEDAIIGLGVRVGSYDLEIVVTAILVQRNVGGNLSEILDGVAHTMRERERIRGEIATLTAQQKLTGFIIGGLPITLGALFWVMNSEYMILLFTTTPGKWLTGLACVLQLLGGWTIKKIIAIEV